VVYKQSFMVIMSTMHMHHEIL